MKKMMLTVVAVLSIVTTYAENTATMTEKTVKDAYDMTVNMRRLGETLGLTLEQMETVANIHNNFCREMFKASGATESNRKKLVDDAVDWNLKYMRYVLTSTQYDKYCLVLNATLVNNGLR